MVEVSWRTIATGLTKQLFALLWARSGDESVPQIVETVPEKIVDVFVPARLPLACRHTSQARKPDAVCVAKDMCVGFISSPTGEQDEQDAIDIAEVSNLTVFVHTCGVDFVSSFGDCCRQEKLQSRSSCLMRGWVRGLAWETQVPTREVDGWHDDG